MASWREGGREGQPPSFPPRFFLWGEGCLRTAIFTPSLGVAASQGWGVAGPASYRSVGRLARFLPRERAVTGVSSPGGGDPPDAPPVVTPARSPIGMDCG